MRAWELPLFAGRGLWMAGGIRGRAGLVRRRGYFWNPAAA